MKKTFLLLSMGLFGICSCSTLPSTVPKALLEQEPAVYAYVIGSPEVLPSTPVLAYQQNIYVTPASCQKVLTALVALKVLGPDYTYTTELYAQTLARKGELKNVVIKFSGDPTFTSEQLLELLKPLKHKKVRGSILLDASSYTVQPYSPNISIMDIGTAYSRPISPLSIDHNTFYVTVQPSELDSHALVDMDVPVPFQNHVITSEDKASVKVLWKESTLHASGSITPHTPTMEFPLGPYAIEDYSKYKVQQALKTYGISNSVKIVKNADDVPDGLKELSRITSADLVDIIGPALKVSDNFVFDHVYLTMVHQYGDPDAVIHDWSDGNRYMKRWIQEYFDVDLESALIVDGSGLSRYNRIQPSQLFAVLQKGYHIPEFVNALPKAHELGTTLHARPYLPASVRAKTGTLWGMHCLCGYTQTADPKVFVMVVSGFKTPNTHIVPMMDKFLQHTLEP